MAKKNNRSKKRQKTPAQLAQAQQAKIDKKKRTVRKYILVGVAVAVVLAAVIVAVIFTQQNKPASENETQTNTAETDATAQTDHTHADDENPSGVAQNGEQNSTGNGQGGSSSSNDTSDETENAEEELEQAVDHYAQAHEMPQQVQAVVQQIQSNPPTQTPSGQAMTPSAADLLYWTHDEVCCTAHSIWLCMIQVFIKMKTVYNAMYRLNTICMKMKRVMRQEKKRFIMRKRYVTIIRFRSSSIETISCAPRPSATRHSDMSFHKFLEQNKQK